MSRQRTKAVRYISWLAVAALLAINIVLVGLNLQKHEIFPFEPDSQAESSLRS